MIPMATLVGMGLGFQFLLPLGDIVKRRRMLITLAIGMSITCIGVVIAPNFASLLAVYFAMGLIALIPSLLPATVSALTPKENRGKILGILLSGTFCGIILARSACGLAAQEWGWRSVYLIAAAGMLSVSQIIRRALPDIDFPQEKGYWALQQSLKMLWNKYPDLRLSCMTNMLLFSCYLGIWSILPLVLSSYPWNFGPAMIGTFGFLGLGSIFTAPLIGRIIDRHGCVAVVKSGIACCLIAISMMTLLKNELAAIIAGTIILDLGFKSSNIANLTRIQLLDTTAGSRMSGQYFMLSYVGAALFSAIVAVIWQHWEWVGSCSIMLGLVVLAWMIETKRRRQSKTGYCLPFGGTNID